MISCLLKRCSRQVPSRTWKYGTYCSRRIQCNNSSSSSTVLMRNYKTARGSTTTNHNRNVHSDHVERVDQQQQLCSDMEQCYKLWKKNPSSVHSDMNDLFTRIEETYKHREEKLSDRDIINHARVSLLIRSYRVRGHLKARLDPLGLVPEIYHPELDEEQFGLDLDATYLVGEKWGGIESAFESYSWQKLSDIVSHLQKAYCRHIGAEFYHLENTIQRDWIQQRMEWSGDLHVVRTKERLLEIYESLARATLFEDFLASEYPISKLFLCAGGEALLPAVRSILETCSALDMNDVVMGMPHRGRLAVLSQILQKPARAIFHEFETEPNMDGFGESRYHLGYSTDLTLTTRSTKTNTSKTRTIHLSLLPNSSHPESVDPLVEGKTRAKQHLQRDQSRTKAMSLIIHGDASFSGQGVVFETLSLSNLKAYSTGGTVHLIMNNQIGYTTDPHDSRSCPYPSDVAKIIRAPIFHVNGNDPIAAANACRLAAQFRQLFHTDVVVDVICYRRYGHDRLNQPSLTQPQMYQNIIKKKTCLELFEEQQQMFKDKGYHYLTTDEMNKIKNSIISELKHELKESKTYVPRAMDSLEKNWSSFKNVTDYTEPKSGVSQAILEHVADVITRLPEGFSPHPIIKQTFQERKRMIQTGQGIDWGMAELLAYGSLIRQGYTVRLSGQDCERGTYAHRHAAVHDQSTFEKYIPLQQLSPLPANDKQNLTGVETDRATFRVANSPLSSLSVLGFDLGYAMESPSIMALFEAQFGDFATGAQVIIDEYISSGEQKWLRMNGITLLLPHGYGYGQAKLERYLQLCSDSCLQMPDLRSQHMAVNLFVVSPTTPANLFHVLRRQMLFKFRKPLFVMIPQRLLKLKACQSNISEFTENSKFKKIIPDSEPTNNSKISRVLFCSGEIYYDLVEYRRSHSIENIAIVRVEELCPFPYDDIMKLSSLYNNNVEWMWVQLEPENAGAFCYVKDRFELAFSQLERITNKRIQYAGRPASPRLTPAHRSQLQDEESQIFAKAFSR